MPQTTQITVDGQRKQARMALEAAREPVASLYVHVPFCFHKCHYCDFYSFVDRQDRQAAFAAALNSELGEMSTVLGGGRPELQTVFVGGGTPSLLRVELWEGLLEALWTRFRPAADLEFTVECNPETVSPELIRVLVSGGVNRVSVGAQSFDPAHLKTLERWHEPENVARAIHMAAEHGIERRSIDLIYGIPGQCMASWRTDLMRALAIAPALDHISCYALTYEPNTAMTRRMERGEFEPCADELEVEMYELTVDLLGEQGYERYEVSNFARQGGACRHNLAYWRQDQWLAAGPSASGHMAGYRWKNIPRLTDWITGVETTGWCDVVDFEPPDRVRAMQERIMTGLRLREGLSLAEVEAECDTFGTTKRLHDALTVLGERGWIEPTGGRVVLTDRGYLFADAAASELMGAVAAGDA